MTDTPRTPPTPQAHHPTTATIIVDTREQLPYSFTTPGVTTIRGTLQTGDYSLQGYESRIAVERKTLDDFVGSVTRSRARFLREMTRLAAFDARCVVVEANWSDVAAKFYRGQVHPASVFGSAVAIIVDHRIPVYFLSTRAIARRFTEKFLLRYHASVTAAAASAAATAGEDNNAPRGEVP